MQKFISSLITIALVASVWTLYAQPAPKLLPFQGRLTDQSGVPVGNSVRLVQFRIFTSPSGGTPVWAGEVHRTTVNGGLVNVLLGATTSLTGVDFDQQLYLEITVDINEDNAITPADPPLLPRQIILPAVFAKESANSRLLAGYGWSQVLGVPDPATGIHGSKIVDGTITRDEIAPGTITSNQIAPRKIDASNIALGAVNSDHLAQGSIPLAALAQAVADALVPAGTIVAFGGHPAKIPRGWHLCNGASYKRSDFPKLYDAIAANWGSGNNNIDQFNVPDLRGLFLRGVNGSRTGALSDPDAGNRANSIPELRPETGGRISGNTGNNVGSSQYDEFVAHTHVYYDLYPHGQSGTEVDIFDSGSNDSLYYNETNRRTESAGGNETRPKNAYVHYIIKY